MGFEELVRGCMNEVSGGEPFAFYGPAFERAKAVIASNRELRDEFEVRLKGMDPTVAERCYLSRRLRKLLETLLKGTV